MGDFPETRSLQRRAWKPATPLGTAKVPEDVPNSPGVLYIFRQLEPTVESFRDHIVTSEAY